MVGFMQKFKRFKSTETGFLATKPVHVNGQIQTVMNNFIILMLENGLVLNLERNSLQSVQFLNIRR